MQVNPIDLAVSAAGGLKPLSAVLGVSAPTIIGWRDGHRPVPVKRCVEIEKATNKKVSRRDLRPHDWQEIWPELNDD